MTRALGVFVVLLSLATAASADKRAKKPTPKAEPAVKVDDKQQADEEAAADEAEAEEDEAPLTPEEIEASLPPHIKGPKLVDLGHDIEIDLPAGMILYERAEAKKMLESYGDDGENALAIIVTLDSTWQVVVDYDDVGYVSDKDANDLDPTDLFRQFELGNKQQNERRKQLGIAPLYLDGWSEMPAYEAKHHHLVWGLKAHSDDGPVINFFRRILGRNGFMSVNLIDSPEQLEQSKQETAPLLGAIHYRVGARYEDHEDGDRDSGMGLSALVLGGAGVAVVKAAKTGFLIKLLLVFKKGFIVIIAALGGLFKWLFGRKKNDDDGLPPDAGSTGPATPAAE
jgi:uncharacterized membrane-anchored protein